MFVMRRPSDEDFLYARDRVELRFAEDLASAGIPLRFDWAVADQVADELEFSLLRINDEKPVASLLGVSVALIKICMAATGLISPTELRAEFAFALLRSYLQHVSVTIVEDPVPRAAAFESMSQLDSSSIAVRHAAAASLRRALGQCMVDRHTGERVVQRYDEFGAPIPLPMIFLGSPMKNVSPADLAGIECLLVELSWEIESHGAFAYAPALLFDPRRPGSGSDRLGHFPRDEIRLAASTHAYFFTYPASGGVGYLIRLAVEHEVPLRLVVGAGRTAWPDEWVAGGDIVVDRRTGEITATEPSTIIRDPQNNIEEQIIRGDDVDQTIEDLRDSVARAMPAVRARFDALNEIRPRRELALDRYLADLEDFSVFELADLPTMLSDLVSRDRLRQLLSDSNLFTLAVGKDRRALDLLNPRIERLDDEQLQALTDAHRQRPHWSKERLRGLSGLSSRRIARMPEAVGQRLRVESRSFTYWLELDAVSR